MQAEDHQPAPWIQDLMTRMKGPVRVQLSPDYGADLPVKVFTIPGRPGCVSATTLGMSVELEAHLRLWQQWWEEHIDVERAYEPLGDEEEW